jgi:hypothetical protein
MPNNVTNRIVVRGDAGEIARLKALVIKDDGGGSYDSEHFDFNAVIERPRSLSEVEAGTTTGRGLAVLGYVIQDGEAVYVGQEKTLARFLNMGWGAEEGVKTAADMAVYLRARNPRCEAMARIALDNLEAYGHADWYDWSVTNWGTKWNAYDYRVVSEELGYWEFVFDTAWSVPEPVLYQLAEMFPSLSFEVRSFDEGWCFAYYLDIRGTEAEERLIKGGDTPEMREMYAEVYGEEPEDDSDDGEDSGWDD